MMANIPKEPYGHEMHIYRQDCDYFYCSLAIKYGADVHIKTQKFQQKDSVEFDRDKFHKPGQNVASSLALTQVLQYCHINWSRTFT